MNQCPTCKIFQPDDQLFCPDCGSRLVAVPHETEEKASKKEQSQKTATHTKTATSKSSRTTVIVLVVFLVVALIGDVWLYSEYSYYSDSYWNLWDTNWQRGKDLQAAEKELDSFNEQSQRSDEALQEAKDQLATTMETLNQLSQAEIILANELDRFSELSNLCRYGTANYFADKHILVMREFETRNVTIHWSKLGTMTWNNSDSDKAICRWSNEWSDNHQTTDVIVTGQSRGYCILSFTNDVDSDVFDVLVIVTD